MSSPDDRSSRSEVTQPGIDAAAAAAEASSDTEFAMTTATSPASRRRMRRRAAMGAAVLAVLLVAGVIIAVKVVPDRTAAPSSAAAPGLVEAVLEGTYRLEFNRAERTVNGALAPLPNPQLEMWWAFRSACTADGCAATGTALDQADQQIASAAGTTQVLHFVDPHWNSLPVRIEADIASCRLDGDRYLKGAQTELVSWSMEPQPDGTLNGLYRETVLTAECGLQGSVIETSFVATRASDAPAAVAIADPATAPAPETAAPTGPDAAGPTLIGTYRLAYADAPARWWAFRSACSQAGCVAVGVGLDDDDQEKAAGPAVVLRFVDGRWQQGQPDRLRVACGNGRNAQVTAESTWTVQPLPHGELHGAETVSYVTGECGNRGAVVEHSFVATHEGAVPAAVVLADPSDFQ